MEWAEEDMLLPSTTAGRTWEANASLISYTSMSSSVSPAISTCTCSGQQ